MAGLNVGSWGNFPGQPQNTVIPKPQQPEQSQRMGRGRRRDEGMDTGPSKPPMSMGGGINVGRGTVQGILPSPQDPFRTYGTVQNGRVVPPSNPYGQNQPIRFTPGGEWGGGGGPINTGPSQMPPNMETPGGGGNPWLERGGFTGGQMPPDVSSGTAGASTPYMPHTIPGSSPFKPTGYFSPKTQIPDINQGASGNIGQRGDQRFQQRNALRNMYGGAGPSLSSAPRRNQLFY